MKVAIIGGGIGGMAAAIGLHKIGVKAHIYEQAPAFKPLGAGIGIGSNAMLALNHLGAGADVARKGMLLHELQFLNNKLELLNRIDFRMLKAKFGEENIAIERSALHESLFQSLDKNSIHFGKKVTCYSQDTVSVQLTFNNNDEKRFDYVIAADGIHSFIRQSLVPQSTPRFAGYTCWRGTTKNTGDVPLHISSEAWSPKGRFGWASLNDDEVYWFACINSRANDDYYASIGKEGVAKLFSHFPDPVERLIKEVHETSFLHHDIFDIEPLSSFHYGRTLLLGDAAHATTPNMGQGAGQAIEDAYELMEAMKEESTIREALLQYDNRRIEKTRKVIQLSRSIGNAAQWDHPLLISFRNNIFPLIPKSLLLRRLTFLFK